MGVRRCRGQSQPGRSRQRRQSGKGRAEEGTTAKARNRQGMPKPSKNGTAPKGKAHPGQHQANHHRLEDEEELYRGVDEEDEDWEDDGDEEDEDEEEDAGDEDEDEDDDEDEEEDAGDEDGDEDEDDDEPSGPAPKDGPAPAVLPDMLLAPVPPTPDADDGTAASQPSECRPRPADKVIQHPFWLMSNNPPRTLCMPHWVLDIVEEGNEILVLAQLNYWFRLGDNNQLRAQVQLDGHVWVAKTHAKLGAEVRRNERQVEKAVKALRRKGFIVVERCRSRFYHGQVVNHYRLNWDAIAAAYQTAVQKWEGKGHERDLL